MSVSDNRISSAWVSGKITLVLTLVVSVSACTSGGLQQELTSCTFPDTVRTPAPSFICDQQLEGYPITRLTFAPPATDIETNDRIERARLEVQHALALEWLVTWFDDVPENQKTQAQQIMLAWLSDELRVVRTRESSAGTLWLLVGIAETESVVQMRLRGRFTSAGIATTSR